jgi:hypothetical protein
MRYRAARAGQRGNVIFERALFPSVAGKIPPPAVEATFQWILCPSDGFLSGTIYSDGSRLDGPSPLLARNGWAFVAVDSDGTILAAASGLTPDWVEDIPGAEAWAVLQAALVAEPGCRYKVDCEPCVKAFHGGLAAATTDKRPLARVHALMFAALGDTPPEAMVWMPAHTSRKDVGVKLLGDGSTLTAIDRESNAEADRLAKLAVEVHRVPKAPLDFVTEHEQLVAATARWIAVATYEANHQEVQPHRDTDASRAAAVANAKARQKGVLKTIKKKRGLSHGRTPSAGTRCVGALVVGAAVAAKNIPSYGGRLRRGGAMSQRRQDGPRKLRL